MPGNQEEPKFITPNPNQYDGHFYYDFQEINPEEGGFGFGLVKVSKAEALVRLGVMPHNNLLSNKVINRFGSRILDIIKKLEPGRLRHEETLTCRTIPDESELLSCWLTFYLVLSL